MFVLSNTNTANKAAVPAVQTAIPDVQNDGHKIQISEGPCLTYLEQLYESRDNSDEDKVKIAYFTDNRKRQHRVSKVIAFKKESGGRVVADMYFDGGDRLYRVDYNPSLYNLNSGGIGYFWPL